ncbi:DUF3576 domain-containing protein [Oceanicella sp. SM1341]|uniref:DUF3576 domain-containing protein n=1 Tax=Oceanicella sp. SM1341 TaxID=1548889 RepID=UPI000E49C990|nr:DUF3576 domain-containing protein [Oceanicella sp. SM1341]
MSLLAACGDSGSSGSNSRILTRSEAQALGDDSAVGTDGSTVGDIFGGGSVQQNTGQSLQVNKYIWKGALETLSFLPLASTDPFSGVIVTDWGTSQAAANERFKVTVFISDERLAADTLRVAVFREVRDGNVWQSAPVQEDVPRQIEDSILTRARQLRIAEAQQEG